MLPHISKCALNRHSNYVILSGITHLGRKTTKDMGCCKVETLSRHDSMHAYKLEMVSYKTSCPHYKMRFHQVAFSREKAREPKKHFCQVQAPGSAINLLKYLLIFGCQIWNVLNFKEGNGSITSRDFWLSRTTFDRGNRRGYMQCGCG